MSHNLSCKNCGWREIFHDGNIREDKGDAKLNYPGFTFSLENCPGFQVIDESKLKEARRQEEEKMKESPPSIFKMFTSD